MPIKLALCLLAVVVSMPLHAADECYTSDVCLGTWAGATPTCTAPADKASATDARDHPYALDDRLVVSVKGACNRKVSALLESKNADTVNIALVLAGVAMKALPLSLSRSNADQTTLTFLLQRLSENEDNRGAWTRLLGVKHAGGRRNVELAIAMGTDVPVNVTTPVGDTSRIVFEVTTTTHLVWTIVIAGVVAIGLYVLFVLSPSVLRDTRGGVYSLGRAQIAFWLLLVLACLVSIFYITGSLERLPSQVLVLLGISSATSFAAKIVGNTKTTNLHVEAAQLADAKTADPAAFTASTGQARLDKVTDALEGKCSSAKHFLRDICSDGEGVSIYRVQVVLFTVTLGGVFVWTVCQVVAMPEFPAELLTLLGLSNSTYVALKVPEST